VQEIDKYDESSPRAIILPSFGENDKSRDPQCANWGSVSFQIGMHYNFARPHKSLANPYPRTPAMAARLTDHVWSIEEIVELKAKSTKKDR